MSVLTCPVCQGAMRELNREGILIDSCTQCRGVWLDRGELEKLMSLARNDEDAAAPQASQPAQYRAPPPPPRYDDRRDDRHHSDRRDYDDDRHRYRKKSKLESLFDLFD